jgi:hypothetical protein
MKHTTKAESLEEIKEAAFVVNFHLVSFGQDLSRGVEKGRERNKPMDGWDLDRKRERERERERETEVGSGSGTQDQTACTLNGGLLQRMGDIQTTHIV